MASEMLSTVSPQTNADSHSLASPSSTAIGNNTSAVETKKDLSSDKTSRNSSSGEEDGNLVIDTDDDGEKVNKEMKPFYGFQGISSERKSPIKNNNNNNSAARGLCNNKHIGNVEKDSNKSLSTNSNGNKIPSFLPTAGFSQSGKVNKTKPKKSSKSNKSNSSMNIANNTTSGASPSTSSAAGSFMNALDTDSNHLHNFDSKIVLPRASSSSDENVGKKTKSNKSKSHHKKQHTKHAEKSGFSSSGNSVKLENEKVKSKSKHSIANAPSAAAFTFTPEASDPSPRSASTLQARSTAEKTNTNVHLTNTQRLNDIQIPHSTSNNNHRIHQLANQGRIPARTASITATATGNGAKGTQACSDREASEIEVPSNQNQTGRKKQKKNQLINSGIPTSRDMGESAQTRDYNYQSTLGKRDRTSINSTTMASGSEGSKTKRMKGDQVSFFVRCVQMYISNATRNLSILSYNAQVK